MTFQCWAGAGKCSIPRGPSVPALDTLLPRRGSLFTKLGAALHSRVSAFASFPGPPHPQQKLGGGLAGRACIQEGCRGAADPGTLTRATQVARQHVCVWNGVPPGPGTGCRPWLGAPGKVGGSPPGSVLSCPCGPWPCGVGVPFAHEGLEAQGARGLLGAGRAWSPGLGRVYVGVPGTWGPGSTDHPPPSRPLQTAC